MTQITEPFPIFYGEDGFPLENGMIYIGAVNQSPRGSPIAVYTDEALTEAIAQPIRTLGGRASYQGAPVNLYVAESGYSIEVQNKYGTPISGPTNGFVEEGRSVFSVAYATATLTELNMLTGRFSEGASAAVFDDPTTSNNGYYSYASGAWVKVSDLPDAVAAVSAQIAQALSGPLYANVADGLAATVNTDEFAVDNGNGTATIYLNNAGSAVLQRTIIIAPSATSAASLLGFIQAGAGAAASTVQAKLRERVSVEDFGATGDGSTDDRAAIQSAIDYVAGTVGGGDVLFADGATYRVVLTTSVTDKGLIVKDNVRLVGGIASTISLICTGDVYGVRLKNNAGVKRLTINTASSTTPGSQGIWHAPISIGPAYGEGGTVASPSSFEGVSGWSIEDVTLSNARAGGAGYLIQGHGGINNGRIDGVYAPSSATSAGIVMLDWSFLGTIDSADIATSRTNFNAGTAYTTHPHNIDIRNIRGGNLSNINSHGVRISGCYGIRVDGVDIEATNFAGVYVTAGDVGFEFAPIAVKPFRFVPNEIRNVAIKDAGNGWGVFADNEADNVAAAVAGSGYSPLLAPIQRADLVLENCSVYSDAGASVIAGFRIQKIIGVRLIQPTAIGFLNGILIEQETTDFTIMNPFVTGNRSTGIFVGHSSAAGDIGLIEGGEIYANSTDAGAGNQAGIWLDGQTNVTVRNVTIGRTGVTETMFYGIRAEADATGLVVHNNIVKTLKASGVAYSFGSGSDFTILKSFSNNTVGSVSNNYGGSTIEVIETLIDTDGVVRRRMRAARASLTSDTTPGSGTFVKGDIIEYNDPDASGFLGTLCTVSGSPGTWKRYGSVEA